MRVRRSAGQLGAAILGAGVCLIAASAAGQPGPYPYPSPTAYPSPYPQPLPVAGGIGLTGNGASSLKGRIGLDAARTLLVSDDPKARSRGVERLGESSDPQAIDTLVSALDPGTVLSRDLDARLMAIRVLANHADRSDVRTYLARELMATPSPSRTTTSMGAMVRGSAALALARQGDDKCLEALLVALEQRGPASEAARSALFAYPPRTLDPFLFVPEGEADNESPDDATSDDDPRSVLDDKKGKGDDEKKKKEKKDESKHPTTDTLPK
jgi:PBS lyase HEAT-like repeat